MKKLCAMKKMAGLAAGLLALGVGFLAQPALANHPVPRQDHVKFWWTMDLPVDFNQTSQNITATTKEETSTTLQNISGGASVLSVPGVKGKAIFFPGNSARITLPQPWGMNGDQTMTFWIKSQQWGPNSGNFWDGNAVLWAESGGNQADWGLSWMSGRITMGSGNPIYRGGNDANYSWAMPNPINDGAWHFVAMTRDNTSGQMKLYVDSLATPVIDQTGGKGIRCLADGSRNTIQMGAIGTLDHMFIGAMDEVRMYNRILTATELQSVKDDPTLNAAPGTAGVDLLRYWKFEDLNPLATTPMMWSTLDTARAPAVSVLSTAIPFDPAKVTAVAGGRFGTAANFISQGANGALARVPSILFANDFSVAFWIKTAAKGNTGNNWWDGPVIFGRDWSGEAKDFDILLMNGTLRYGMNDGNAGNNVTLNSATPINDNVWHHVVCTRDSTTGSCTLYIDGNRTARNTGTIPAALTGVHNAYTDGWVYFMQPRNDATQNLDNTLLDDVMVYDVSLTWQEANQLFKSQTSVPNVQVSPTGTLRFAQVDVREDKTTTPTTVDLTVTNTGTKAAIFSGNSTVTPGFALFGTNVADFSIVSILPALTSAGLAPGQSVVVKLQYSPAKLGNTGTGAYNPPTIRNSTAQLVITTNDDLAGMTTVNLTGDAVPVSMSNLDVE